MHSPLILFDAYGTLFDVAAATRKAALVEPALDGVWPRVSEDWCRKQLEYRWLRRIMGEHADFHRVTSDALSWALEAQGLPESLHGPLMALSGRLEACPEVREVLRALRAAGCRMAILSNATPDMLSAAVTSAVIGDCLEAVLSIESVGRYKPDPAVYAMGCAHFAASPGEVVLISSNGWDIAGAARHALRTIWVNRTAVPADRLSHGPAQIVRNLEELTEMVVDQS